MKAWGFIAYSLYRGATYTVSPLLPFYLRRRMRRGKEDARRLPERLGITAAPRPEGMLVWLHAASVGEANSIVPLMEGLQRRYPAISLLLTTGTVTSARLMEKRLPPGAIHQYAPVDTPQAAARFIRHWRPDVAFWAESELWPNLIMKTSASGCRMALINARMSTRSFRRWLCFPSLIRPMLSAFSGVYAQSENDAGRFRALGVGAECIGNLKYDGEPLETDADALLAFERAAAGRHRWLAASIHPGEDRAAAEAHVILKTRFTQLLTVAVPRHPERGEEMRRVFESHGLKVAQRSRGEAILPDTDVYLADTMGELGLFYRVCPLVFIGGSLVAHGGQNPLEPARLGAALLCGPYMFNFEEIAMGLAAADAIVVADNASILARLLGDLLVDTAKTTGMRARASAWVIGRTGVGERLLDRLAPLLGEAEREGNSLYAARA